MADKYDVLKLENQICFPLYAVSKEIIKHYKPHLEELDLTYTQYITMMVMWEKGQLSVKELGECLYLDSGTLTPVLKTLEKKEYVKRERSKEDERVLLVSVTDLGMELREKALNIPAKIGSCVSITPDEARHLYSTLYKILGQME